MFSWLLLFLVQTILASRGSLRLHRKLGFFSVSLAILMWISMVAASIRQVLAKDGPFFLDIVSLQLVLLVMFTVFFSWAFRARQDPGTHRRAMTFSVVVLLQAATDRILWLPAPHMPDQHWELDLYVYALIVPLFVFDLVSSRRLHPVTLIGTAIVVTGHVVVNLLWGTAAWHRFVEGMKRLA